MEKQSLYIFNFSIFLLKVFVVTSIIGVLFSFAFEKLIVFKSEINGASKVNRILSETNKNEIPIFGSSRAQGNFVPSLLGNDHFNYGIDGTQANIWLFFLDQELKKEKSTPILLNWDLTGLVYSDGDIGNYIPNWRSTKDILSQKGEFYYNVPFLKYFGEYEKGLKYFVNEKINLTKATDNGGSFEKNVLVESKFQEMVEARENSTSYFSLNPELLSRFNELIGSTDRRIVFVVSPYHESYLNSFKNIEKANHFLKSLAMYKNLTVIDMRDYITENKFFMNTTHLNYAGAVAFSKKLREELKVVPGY